MGKSFVKGFISFWGVIILGVLLIGLLSAGILFRSRLSFFSQAAYEKTTERVNKPVYTPKVLYILLNPTDPTGDVATKYYGWSWEGKSLVEVEDFMAKANIEAINKLSQGRISYRLARTLRINQFPKYFNNFEYTVANYENCINNQPLSNGLSCEEQKKEFDHEAFVRDNNVCDIANESKADEIWLMAPPFITRWESWMVGPDYGFWVNGNPVFAKRCKKFLVVMSPNYGLKTMLHIYGHRVESILDYLSLVWKKKDKDLYLKQFLNADRYNLPIGQVGQPYPGPGCGNAHLPLNALGHYEYDNTTVRGFNCADWNNFPDHYELTNYINCNAWGCTNEGWNAYWLGAIPHRNGEAKISLVNGKKVAIKKDWWYYILYPKNVLDFVESGSPGELFRQNTNQAVEEKAGYH